MDNQCHARPPIVRVDLAMQSYNYTTYHTPSSGGYDMRIFVKNEEKCEHATVLEYYWGGNIFGSPLDAVLSVSQMRTYADTIHGCHIVPYVRSQFDTIDSPWSASVGAPQNTQDDAVAAYKWVVDRYMSCTICDTKFVIGGASGGALTTLYALAAANTQGVVRKADLTVLLAAQLACDGMSMPSMERIRPLNTLQWSVDEDTITHKVALATNPTMLCPEKYPLDYYRAFSKKYFIAVDRQDGFVDMSLRLGHEFIYANIPVELFIGNQGGSHAFTGGTVGRSQLALVTL